MFFTAPLVEGYSLAKEPYQEFRKGVDIVTYQKDSTGAVDATLTANYAIHYGESENYGKPKGNVVSEKNPTDRSSTPSSCSGTRKRAGSGLRRFQDRGRERKFLHRRRIRVGRSVERLEISPNQRAYVGQYRADTGRGFYVGETRCGQCFRCEGGSFRTACQTGPADTGERTGKLQLTPVESNDRSL